MKIKFVLSKVITLKDISRQQGGIGCFAEEAAVVEIPFDLQEDQIPGEKARAAL